VASTPPETGSQTKPEGQKKQPVGVGKCVKNLNVKRAEGREIYVQLPELTRGKMAKRFIRMQEIGTSGRRRDVPSRVTTYTFGSPRRRGTPDAQGPNETEIISDPPRPQRNKK